MAETRAQTKERLQKAGQWEKYVAIRTELSQGGMKPVDARTEALARIEAMMVDAKEPVTALDRPAEVAAVQELPDFTRQADDAEAVRWVATHIANPAILATAAPGPQAWGLLCWVRRSPTNEATFWGSIWPKVASKPKADEEDDEPGTVDLGTEKCIALAEQLIQEALEVSKK